MHRHGQHLDHLPPVLYQIRARILSKSGSLWTGTPWLSSQIPSTTAVCIPELKDFVHPCQFMRSNPRLMQCSACCACSSTWCPRLSQHPRCCKTSVWRRVNVLKASPLVCGRALRGKDPHHGCDLGRSFCRKEVSVEPVDRESRDNELRITCLGHKLLQTLSRSPNRVPVHAYRQVHYNYQEHAVF